MIDLDEIVEGFKLNIDRIPPERLAEIRRLLNSEDMLRWQLVGIVGSKIRGDWSGTEFDGRDVRNWLETAADGTIEEVNKLIEALSK